MFANKIKKTIKNNDEIYMSKSKIEKKQKNISTNKQEKNITTINKTIKEKINEIINSKKYIYKIPVMIELEDKQMTTKIIGKNRNSIITIDNEKIEIDKIKNIKICDE